ncbi:MAG: hypothetical protein IJ062_10930 [Firmicutes bacterium]|nr:hypothetical protein [Bacillota bacterium]
MIKDVKGDTKYSVTEDNVDYTPNVVVDENGDSDGKIKDVDAETTAEDANYTDNNKSNKYLDQVTGIGKNTTLTFTNNKVGILPTGIIMSVAPAAIVGIGVLIAIFALVLGGKKKELDEE